VLAEALMLALGAAPVDCGAIWSRREVQEAVGELEQRLLTDVLGLAGSPDGSTSSVRLDSKRAREIFRARFVAKCKGDALAARIAACLKKDGCDSDVDAHDRMADWLNDAVAFEEEQQIGAALIVDCDDVASVVTARLDVGALPEPTQLQPGDFERAAAALKPRVLRWCRERAKRPDGRMGLACVVVTQSVARCDDVNHDEALEAVLDAAARDAARMRPDAGLKGLKAR
jgi:hypothetical protein